MSGCVWFVVCSLALLDPLTCLIHCATLQRGMPAAASAPRVAVGFVCPLASAAPERDQRAPQGAHAITHGAPLRVRFSVLQLFYEYAPPGQFVLLLPPLLLAFALALVAAWFVRAADSPLTPPPRHAA